MSKHIGTLSIGVICQDKPIDHFLTISVQVFENLYSFGARSGTHVKNRVVRFNLEQSDWYHRHFFLSEDPSRFYLVNYKPMKLL
jgi:hypothetical protein